MTVLLLEVARNQFQLRFSSARDLNSKSKTHRPEENLTGSDPLSPSTTISLSPSLSHSLSPPSLSLFLLFLLLLLYLFISSCHTHKSHSAPPTPHTHTHTCQAP